MRHDEFREAMTNALVEQGGTLISTEAHPWDPRDEECENELHPGFQTQVNFPHWIAFLTTDDDPDWNGTDDEDVEFDLAVYFQDIVSPNIDEARTAVSGALPAGWMLETAGDGVPGCWLETKIDFDRRKDVQQLIDEFVKGCRVVHERISSWRNAPKIERLI